MASMKKRLIIALFLFALIPVMMFGTIQYYFVYLDLEDQIKNTFRTESEGLGTSMRLLFELRMQQISALSLNENIQNLLLESHNNPDKPSVDSDDRDLDPGITQLFMQFGEATEGKYNKIFSDIVGFYDYHILTTDGKLLYDSDTSSLDKDFFIESEFLIKLFKPIVSYQFDKQTNDRAMVVSTPILNILSDSPQILGVLSAVMGIKTTDHILIDFRNMNTDENYLVDMNKMLVSESRFIEDAPFNVQVDTVAVRECIEYDRNHVGFYDDYRGIPIFGSSYCAKDLGFVLIREIDAEELFIPLAELMYQTVFIGLGFGVLSVIIGLVVSNAITNPLSRLEKATNKIASGEYDIPLKKEGVKELDSLIESFNTMTKTISDDKIDLDSQLEKITVTEKKFRSLFEKSLNPVVIIDPKNATFLDCNDAFIHSLLYSKDEIVGNPIELGIQKDHLHIIDEIKKLMKEHLTTEKKEFVIARKDGKLLNYIVSGFPIFDANLNKEVYVFTVSDVSELYVARKKILEQLKNLKVVDNQKEEFSAMITHELKTPLATTIGYSDMLRNLKMGELNEEQKFAIDEIYSASLALQELIENVLTVEKLEMHKLSFNIEKTTVKELLKQAYNRLAPIMVEKQIEFLTSAEDLTINIDKEKMMEVFSNLVRNSVDFVPASGGKIEIASKSDNSNILFSVIDNGAGIPKDKLGNLFTKFYQVDTSMTRKHGGSGLGLAICKGIIEGFGGKIWIESEEGKGTVIYFTIPKESRIK